ncbi:hypothetical protein GGTG_02005 [Gaeumannomyces tritici R3-111a-1]|uniref:Uncharacterized protein n=1 Tax=Gaeumannomyces tritici (strain R3-111a-1) TaxID=644352 RepID=J3NL64_GAET3|nr:hypothetical protein GGTG_02005 [Gaeumannomyces tritici R3-111a-1]EJT82031.1 hypothetical protein GGTG_02005 [Gaeumannomyces tritici R3-111a-1]
MSSRSGLAPFGKSKSRRGEVGRWKQGFVRRVGGVGVVVVALRRRKALRRSTRRAAGGKRGVPGGLPLEITG